MLSQSSLKAPDGWLNWLEQKANYFLSFEKVIFVLLVLLQLAPVWIEKYILNTDGPAHTYTSRVLLDYFFGKNLPLYRQYFALDYYADPNWFSRFWLMLLQLVFSGRVAEKILVSAYLILFPVLFRKLVLKVNPENAVLSFFIFPVLSHHVFNYGFYNYSFALAFVFGFIWFWKTKHNNLHFKNCAWGLLLSTALYFTHLWGFILAGFFTGVMIVWESFLAPAKMTKGEAAKDAGIKLMKLLGMMLPGIILAIVFIKTFLLEERLYPDDMPKLMEGFFKLNVLEIYSHREHWPAHFYSVIILALLGLSLLMKIRKWKWEANDAFLLIAIIVTAVYFIEPEKLTVGAFWIFRIVLLPYLFIIIWSATVQHMRIIKAALAGLAVFISIYFSAVRWPYYHRVSESVEEYLSVSSKIPLHSTVLPISFNHKGNMPDGTDVCPEMWKFIHAFDYACIDREAISLEHNDWIPLKWKQEKNPFEKIGTIEGQPPALNFAAYPGGVQYVVTWCMENNYYWTWEWKSVKDQLDSRYTLVDSSAHGLAKLYRVRE